MTASRFFRLVWRANGLLALAVLALGAALIVGELASDALREVRAAASDEPPPAAVAADGERLRLGDVEAVTGTSNVVLPLETEDPSSSSSGGEGPVTRNLLFYDGATGAARWLRKDHLGVIAAREFVRGAPPPGREEDGPVRFVRYELATADTDGDGEVTADDARDVAVSGPAGDRLATVLERPDAVLGYQQLAGDVLLVFHRRGDATLVTRVDLAARRAVSTAALPSP